MPSFPRIDPPVLNTACLWASTLADLRALYTSPYTGAITTRTASHPYNGFNEDAEIHKHTFVSSSRQTLFMPPSSDSDKATTHPADHSIRDLSDISSLNTYGYSPLGLADYIAMVKQLEDINPEKGKPVIFSVAGPSSVVAQCWITLAENRIPNSDWCMEINLGCPNIAGKPPLAYDPAGLSQFINEFVDRVAQHVNESTTRTVATAQRIENLSKWSIPIGLKLPPYTYVGQFDGLIDVIARFNKTGITGKLEPDNLSEALLEQFDSPWPVAFLTSVNTLGSSMLMEEQADGWQTALHSDKPGSTMGLGGLAGAALHPLALGNVRTLRQKLRAAGGLEQVKIIGVGGVSDSAGAARMLAAGADVVGVATALGMRGVSAFEAIAGGQALQPR